MMRRFSLRNEYGQEYSLTDVKKGFLHEPDGLGYKRNRKYTAFGTEWVRSDDKLEQVPITGTLVFSTDDAYQKSHELIEFILTSEELTLTYQTEVGLYYRDVDINSYGKTEIKNGALECPIEFTPKTLWYLPDNLKIKLTDLNTLNILDNYGEPILDSNSGTIQASKRIGLGLRFTFQLPNRFISYSNGAADIYNDGHVPAPFKATVSGPISNPSIILLQNRVEIARVNIIAEIGTGDTLEYSSKDGDIYLYILKSDGSKIDLGSSLDITNENIFKIPIGSSQLKIEAESIITTALFTIYKQYIAI